MKRHVQLTIRQKLALVALICLLPYSMQARVMESGGGTKSRLVYPDAGVVAAREAASTYLMEPGDHSKAVDAIVSGKVTNDEDEPLPGATVVLKGTTVGTTTNSEGDYSLSIPDSDLDGGILIFSFIGYVSREVSLNSRLNVNASLEKDVQQLDEVVVVGYGNLKRKEVVGSISKVQGSDITKVPTTSMAEALQGQASGLFIENSSGHPGSAPEIKIRGKGSVNLGTSPLWIIDGVPIQTGSVDLTMRGSKSVSPLAMINPNDIESIEVLKDAAATAIYGNRGSNGVIIVTTRSAKSEQSSFNVNYDGGFYQVPFKQNDVLVDSETWWQMVDQSWANAGFTTVFEPSRIINSQFLDERPTLTREEAMATNTDHVDAMTQSAQFHQFGITANKGFKKGGVMFSLNYRDEKGLLRENDLERLTARFNFTSSPVESVTLGVNVSMLYLKHTGVQSGNGKGFGGWGNWTAMMPWYKIYDENSPTGYWGANSGFNPIAFSDPNLIRNESDEYRTISNAFIQWETPLAGLNLRSEFGVDLLINNGSYWRSEFLDPDNPFINEAAEKSVTRHVLNYNAYLNYDRSFGESKITITAGAEATRQGSYTRQLEGTQIFSSYPELRNPLQLTNGDGSFGGEQYLMGMFGRANYVFNDRYILNASIRRDGHSVLSEKNRWATFTAFGAGWVITDEAFFDVPAVSFLKLRGSYGTTGNTGLTAEMTQINWGLRTNRYGGGYLPGGTTMGPIGSTDLKWETTTSTDIGLDFGFLNDRITGSFAYYTKDVSDLILRGAVPISTGFTSNQVWENIGDLENWGWEVDISSLNIDKGSFTWNTDFNISFNDNRIIRLNEFEKGKGAESNQNIRKEGEKLDTWYLAHYVGVDPDRGIVMVQQRDQEQWNSNFVTEPTGTLLPGNNANSSANKMILHGKSALPTFFGGITNRFNYKNLDLSILLVFAGGNYLYNTFLNETTRNNGIYGLSTEMVGNTWEKPGDIAEFPQLHYGNNYKYDNDGNPTAAGTNFETIQNDRFLEKGNYMRIRNLQVGYSLPQQSSGNGGLQNVRIYVGVANWFTFTKFRGLDPETNRDLPVPRNYNFGVSLSL